ncbi:MAG: ATP-dependent 6-phosphofructokinase [Acidimicrobiaceae bacterium]|nr:ATP-dependent 6-phosphofructokinase [Acidimicrobiaceae bacterium]
MMRLGILTGGGDCPGLNAVIRAIVRKGERHYGDQAIGFLDGWRGVVDDNWIPLDVEACRGLLPKGGTVLGTSRHTPFSLPDGMSRATETIRDLELDALIAIGGEGTLSCASEMSDRGFPVVGIPKTIDNDVGMTERTFGFDTAVTVATEAIDRLHTTAESHDRVIFVEVMGRNVGHIATWAGIAGGASYILVPEEPFDLDELCEALLRRQARGRYASIVVVAEGPRPGPVALEVAEPPVDAYGHKRLGGIANVIAAGVEARTGFETRVTILGHVQRGGSPTPFDRVLATRFGVAAIDAVHDGRFGHMVALRGDAIELVALQEATARLKPVGRDLLDVAHTFFA